MPIRFRCTCGQLLGIARRKAGSTVRCPSCQKDVQVPPQEEAPVTAPPPPPEPGGPALFERDDFDALLQGGMSMGGVPARGSAVQAPPPPARPQPMPPAVPAVLHMEAQPWPVPAAPSVRPAPTPGIYLTPGRATVLTVVVILLLALAFGSGLIVGRFL
jgi:hypothetical protein